MALANLVKTILSVTHQLGEIAMLKLHEIVLFGVALLSVAWASWRKSIWMTLHHTGIGGGGGLCSAEESENRGSIPLAGFALCLGSLSIYRLNSGEPCDATEDGWSGFLSACKSFARPR